jgi:hypothetical protein
MDNDVKSDHEGTRRDLAEAAPAVRLPYEPPRVESGVAFEKVLLLSGCNSGFFCPIPC